MTNHPNRKKASPAEAERYRAGQFTNIVIEDGGQSYDAVFDLVRTGTKGSLILHLGWASLEHEGTSFRFPVVVMPHDPDQNRKGYTVYSAWDWQAPASTWGDLADPADWQFACSAGTGRFINRARKSTGRPLDLSALSLPIQAD